MEEAGYLALVKRILDDGEYREGRNGGTKSVFGEKVEFRLNNGNTFPLLTTKRVFWRGVVEELLWFLRGSTDVKELQAKNIHIWDGNSTRAFLDSVGLHDVPEGDIGLGYGKQWRNFGGIAPGSGVDQLAYVIDELRKNPAGRRCLLSAWNPVHLHMAALPPCHVMYQFYVGTNGLSCQMYQRSQDCMSGAPFNYASTALLTMILAHILRVPADRVIVVSGDTHVYEPHFENAAIQVTREPYAPPRVAIRKEPPPPEARTTEMIQWIEGLTFEDFELTGYVHHPALKFEMVA